MADIGIFAGSFDPFTLGHFDIAERAAKLFSRLYIAVASDTGNKKCIASVAERTEIVRKSVMGLKNVTVESFDGNLTDFARKIGAFTVVRGLRTFKDFEYEQTIARVYKSQYSDIELVYLISSPKYSKVSATAARALVRSGASAEEMVCAHAYGDIRKIYGRR